MNSPSGAPTSSMTMTAASRDSDDDDGRLYRCCACSLVLHDPVLLLDCLHNCCRECLNRLLAASTAAADAGTAGGFGSVDQACFECPACTQIVSGSRSKPNALLAAQIAALGLEVASTCGVCFDDISSSSSAGINQQPGVAVSWCSDCHKSMCDRCSARHRIFSKGHETFGLLPSLEPPAGSNPAVCDACALPGAVTVTWCGECSQTFCKLCSQRHAFFSMGHRTMAVRPGSGGFFGTGGQGAGSSSSSRRLAAAAAVPVHVCAEHGKRCEFVCFGCECKLECVACAKACLEARHDVAAISSDAALSKVQRASAQVTTAADALRRKLSALAVARPHLLDSMAEARRHDAETIKGGTRAALDVIECAHERAESLLRDAYESLADRVPPTLASNADRLGRQLRHACEYLGALVDSGDVVCLLDQQPIVLACLQQLASEAAALPPVVVVGGDVVGAERAAEWSLVVSEQRQPDFDELVQRCVGIVRWDPDTPFFHLTSCPTHPVSQDQPQRNEDHVQNITEPFGHSCLPIVGRDARASDGSGNDGSGNDGCGNDGGSGNDAAARMLHFGSAAGSFRSVSACHDVASTSNGRVLLAALSRGLKHYDCSGKKMQTWHPASDEFQRGLVSSVDALDDGEQIAAAVINARRVYLLRIDSAGDWVEGKHFDLWLWPYRVATRHDLLAIVGASTGQNSKTTQFGPGRQLVVMSMSDGVTVLELDLDFDSNAVTLAEHTAIVAGSEVAGQSGGGGKARHFVDAYSYRKERLWRYETVHDVCDVCVPPAALASRCPSSADEVELVYLALPDNRHVLTLDARCGKQVGEVLKTSGQASPNRLSFCCGQEQQSLVVLSARGIVTVYPADRCGESPTSRHPPVA